jgi:RHS repeat-associated protein
MLTIDDATPAHKVGFVLDALGRHASQTIGTGGGAVTTTYAYLGTSNTVSSMSVGAAVTTTSLIDAIGNRLGQGTGSAFGGYLIADLHGNIAAAVSAGGSPALLSAYRYDAYGETCGSWTADAGSLSVPWRFGGRLLESISGTTTDLYDFGARSYDPSLGAFTSFDSVGGSAQNPLTLNRYLYANANPATLVDPDGHVARMYDEGPGHRGRLIGGSTSGTKPIRTMTAAEKGDLMPDNSGPWEPTSGTDGTTPVAPAAPPQTACERDTHSWTCGQWRLHLSYLAAKAQWEADWQYCHSNNDEHLHECYQNPGKYDYVTIGGVFGGCSGEMREWSCQLPLWDPSEARDPYQELPWEPDTPVWMGILVYGPLRLRVVCQTLRFRARRSGRGDGGWRNPWRQSRASQDSQERLICRRRRRPPGHAGPDHDARRVG